MASDRIRRLMKSALLPDASALLGAASFIYGVALLSEPAAWIVAGVLLMGGGVLATLSRRNAG